jgi:hypothetical protein
MASECGMTRDEFVKDSGWANKEMAQGEEWLETTD